MKTVGIIISMLLFAGSLFADDTNKSYKDNWFDTENIFLNYTTFGCQDVKKKDQHRVPAMCPLQAAINQRKKQLYIDFSYPMTEEVEISVSQNEVDIINEHSNGGLTSFEYDLSEYPEGEYRLDVTIGDSVWTGHFIIAQ